MSRAVGLGERERYDTPRVVGIILFGVALAAFGTTVAMWMTTSGGDLELEETTIETESGLELSATVYEPPEATPDEPAPAVTLIHGYTGEQGTMESFAQEFADRGYVTITVDQPGHGHSDPPAFADNWGGSATLEFAHSLDIVDEDRVAMVGHSMGGFASLAAAVDHPDGYESVVLVGSTWGDPEGGEFDDVPVANETFPRNLAVLFAPYDEFSHSMYGESVPGNVPEGEKLRSVFGVNSSVVAGETYGSIDNGTARTFGAPPTVHTGMHRSPSTIAKSIEWVNKTMGEPAHDVGSQRWYWATGGHVLTMIGAILVAIGVSTLVWRRQSNGTPDIERIQPSRKALVGLSALPALLIYPLYGLGVVGVPVTRITHQQLTHGYVLWALGTAALVAGLAYWRTDGLWPVREELLPDRATSVTAATAAMAGGVAMYLTVFAANTVPGGDARVWMTGLGVLSPLRFVSALVYLLPITISTVVLAAGLYRLFGDSPRLASPIGRGLVLTCGGLVLFLTIQYIPLFLGIGLPVPELGPLAIETLRATGLLISATIIVVATNRLTDQPLVGGILAGIVLTWMIVSNSPIHVTVF